MKCIITYNLHSTAGETLQVNRQLIALDQSAIILSCSDRPTDLLMECIATHVESENSSYLNAGSIQRALEDLSQQGRSTMRIAALPHAVRTIPLDPNLPIKAEHRIDITFVKNAGYLESAFISLDGAEPIALRASAFRPAPELNGDHNVPLFLDRLSTSHRDREPRPEQIAAGSVLCGILDAAFEKTAHVSVNALSANKVILAGIVTALRGHDFSSHHLQTSQERSVSACRQALTTFRRHGYLLSDRSWNPETLSAGPRLAEARKAAVAVIRDDAAAVWHHIDTMEADLTYTVITELLEARNIRGSQFQSYLSAPRTTCFSNHQILQITRHIRELEAQISRP